MKEEGICKHDAFSTSRPRHEEKMERYFGHIINEAAAEKRADDDDGFNCWVI
jgi:hypothetical protein